MGKLNVLRQMNETQPHPPAQARFVSAPQAAAPDPVMLERIGKGLHDLYDGVPKSTLPIYFGPVLGELYLTPVPRPRSA
jgi:hypothetical protein